MSRNEPVNDGYLKQKKRPRQQNRNAATIWNNTEQQRSNKEVNNTAAAD